VALADPFSFRVASVEVVLEAVAVLEVAVALEDLAVEAAAAAALVVAGKASHLRS
jgi:hypothetical protein